MAKRKNPETAQSTPNLLVTSPDTPQARSPAPEITPEVQENIDKLTAVLNDVISQWCQMPAAVIYVSPNKNDPALKPLRDQLDAYHIVRDRLNPQS